MSTWRRTGGLVALLLVLLASWSLWLAVAQAGPWDGTRISGSRFPDSAWGDDGVVLNTTVDPDLTTLRKGDRVVAVDGEEIGAWTVSHRSDEFEVGDRLVYEVVRGGALDRVEVTLHPYGWTAAFRHGGVIVALELGLLAIAALILAYRRTEPSARVIVAVALLIPFGLPGWPLSGQVLELAQAPWPLWPQLVASCVWAVVLGSLLPHFALVFPRPPERLRRPRLTIVGLYAAPFVAHAAYLALTLPLADSRLERVERISTVWLSAQLYAPVLVIALMVWSYRRTTDGGDRDRIRLVAGAMLLAFAVNIAVVQLPQLTNREALLPTKYWGLVFLLCPLAVGVAIVRHQLFDITVVLRRSILAAGLVGVLAAVYAACVWLVGSPDRSQLPFFLVGTCAGLLLPLVFLRLRRRMERGLYGARGDPLEVIEEITALDSGGDADSVLRGLCALLAQTLRLPYVAITLEEAGTTFVATHGTARGQPVRIRLTRGEEVFGHLDLGVAPGREPFGASDAELLAAIAAHTSSTLRTTLLNSHLQESQQRLLTTREEERRRIRRDLHDGVQPPLALLSMNLEVVQDLLGTDPVAAGIVVERARARVRDAISEVRATVNDLKPTLLDEVGLEDAIRLLAERTTSAHHQNGRGLTVEVAIETTAGPRPMTAAVESAAYRIVSEAVNNVSRHAEATSCTITIRHHDGLEIAVADNGKGIPLHPRAGTGLQSINERAAELGGAASVVPGRNCGTVVSATLPLPTDADRRRAPHG
jgi:two-component system NarL family sensor kinase